MYEVMKYIKKSLAIIKSKKEIYYPLIFLPNIFIFYWIMSLVIIYGSSDEGFPYIFLTLAILLIRYLYDIFKIYNKEKTNKTKFNQNREKIQNNISIFYIFLISTLMIINLFLFFVSIYLISINNIFKIISIFLHLLVIISLYSFFYYEIKRYYKIKKSNSIEVDEANTCTSQPSLKNPIST